MWWPSWVGVVGKITGDERGARKPDLWVCLGGFWSSPDGGTEGQTHREARSQSSPVASVCSEAWKGWRPSSVRKPETGCPTGETQGDSSQGGGSGRKKWGRQHSLLLINIIYYLFKNSFLQFIHVGWQNKCRQFTNQGDCRKMGGRHQRENRGTPGASWCCGGCGAQGALLLHQGFSRKGIA